MERTKLPLRTFMNFCCMNRKSGFLGGVYGIRLHTSNPIILRFIWDSTNYETHWLLKNILLEEDAFLGWSIAFFVGGGGRPKSFTLELQLCFGQFGITFYGKLGCFFGRETMQVSKGLIGIFWCLALLRFHVSLWASLRNSFCDHSLGLILLDWNVALFFFNAQ